MESKIMIDIRPTGEPFLYIDFKASDDLRDKVLSRFLYESGAMNLRTDGEIPNPTRLDLHVLWFDQQSGRVQAMVEHPAGETPEKSILPIAGKIQQEAFKKADDWADQNLTHDLYKKWHTDMFGYPPLKNN